MKMAINKKSLFKIMLLTWMIVFVWMNGNVQSLWIDELSSIGYIRSGVSFSDMMYTYLFCDTNMPLYSIILYFLYRILPFGEQYLLIPSIVFCTVGIICLSNLMREIEGERAGLIVFCLGCASNAIIWQGVWEARCYALTFMMSVITLGYYVETMRVPNKKNLIKFCIAAFFFMMTHWFACVLLAIYGIVDLGLIWLKKKPWQSVLTYIPGLLFFIPWFLISFISKQEEYNNFWGMIPEWKNMLWTILFWLSGRKVLWYICLLTGIIVCSKFFWDYIIKNREVSFSIGMAVLYIIAIVWVIGIMFVYSRYLNPEGSLYIDRYFIVIAPHILLLTAYGLNGIIDFFDKIGDNYFGKKESLKGCLRWCARSFVIIVVTIFGILCYRDEYVAIRKPFQQFREASEYLIKDERIWDKDSLFVASNKYCGMDGFIEYYFSKRGYKQPSNIIDGRVNSYAESRFYPNYAEYSEVELLEYKTIIDFRIHMSFDDKFMKFLKENYTITESIEELGIKIWEKNY